MYQDHGTYNNHNIIQHSDTKFDIWCLNENGGRLGIVGSAASLGDAKDFVDARVSPDAIAQREAERAAVIAECAEIAKTQALSKIDDAIESPSLRSCIDAICDGPSPWRHYIPPMDVRLKAYAIRDNFTNLTAEQVVSQLQALRQEVDSLDYADFHDVQTREISYDRDEGYEQIRLGRDW